MRLILFLLFTVHFGLVLGELIRIDAAVTVQVCGLYCADGWFLGVDRVVGGRSTSQRCITSQIGQRGADALCNLAEQGVRVRVLTNSLVSNDVAAVHTGYIRHRKELLRCGVKLYELNEQLKKIEAERFTWLPGLSKSSLHAKTMAMDKSTMFVGSFNFDQRSLNINTEIGIVFKNPEIAAHSSDHFDKQS